MNDSRPIAGPLRIVLIDDEPTVIRALSLLLKAIGCSSLDFYEPEKAAAFLQTVECREYDLILCDLKMPGIDGLGVLATRNRECQEIPFVLMSGHADSATVQLALERGASGFLAKPFTPDQLQNIVEKITPPPPKKEAKVVAHGN